MTDISASEQSGDRPRIVMFVDISGSSRLFALRGDAVALELTIASIGMMEEETTRCGGVTIKRTGDGILAAFDRADDAVATAVALQNRLYGDGIQPAEERLHILPASIAGPLRCATATSTVMRSTSPHASQPLHALTRYCFRNPCTRSSRKLCAQAHGRWTR